MLALSFSAGRTRFALRAQQIVRVLAAQPILPLAAAPASVIGLIEFEGDLLPVIDLQMLLENQAGSAGFRLVVAEVDEPGTASGPAGRRRLALRVEQAWEMVEIRSTLPRMHLAQAEFLGDFVRNAGDAQLLELAALLPEQLRALAREPMPT